MLSEIERYRFKIRVYLNVLGFIASFTIVSLRLFSNEYIAAFMSIMSGVYFLCAIYLLVVKHQYLWKGRGFAIFISLTMINTNITSPEYGIYWVYVGVLSFFLLMELKEASLVAGFFTLSIFYIIAPHHSILVLARIYTTLLLVWLFAFLLSYHIEQLLKEVNSLATHDPLTKALNRHTFHTSIESALSSYLRYNLPATLFIFDLDHFKSVNDSYGHQAGDKILKDISKSVKSRLRESDQLFRYGGEEFAVLLPQTDQDDGYRLAEELRAMIEKSHHSCIDRSVTISGGLSQAQKGDQVTTWIERCDKALYKAKAKGRNQIVTAGSTVSSTQSQTIKNIQQLS